MKVKFGAGLVAAFLCVSGGAALAHSFLVDASPSAKDHVAAAPKVVKLRFGGGVEPAYSTISILDESGKTVVEGAKGAPDKPRELTLDAPALAAGKYVVKYRVLSSDGHIVEGKYEFTVDAR
ncbi:copper resistance CopC family protein [Methylosinus sp. Ce-a6]|uniref:copper resistance CopC family protein n=1 Tax=Methylosinus sp. Ce-a6 TaxID=2172005 RepID=UPI00135C4ADD|nr:copper resistance CopC family protein [Methylosinus sp. Ce-a6]